MPENIELKIKGIVIRGLQWGNPSGEKVLALHGWLDNVESFSNLAPLLKEYCVVAVDLPGHGLSGHWPQHQHYHLWAGVEDVEHILDALGWERCHLLGHSMGAAISTLYAGTFPDRLKSLTLIEAIGPMAGEVETAPLRLAEAINRMKKHNPQQSAKESKDSFIHARLQGSLKLADDSAKKIVERGLIEQASGFAWRNDKRLRYTSMMRLPEDVIVSFIAAIRCPVLGIFADDGLFTVEQAQARWQHVQAEKEWHWLGGGHHLHLDGDVNEIADLIHGFLLRHV